MHTVNKLGNTLKDVKKDGFKNARIIKFFKENDEQNIKTFLKGVKKIFFALKKDKPKAVFILGDRFEAMVAGIAAHFASIPIIHSGGGEVTLGSKDNIYRYVISHFASLHLATTKKNQERLKNLGFNKSVYFTGSSAVDDIYKFKKEKKKFKKEFFLRNEDFALMTFHGSNSLKDNLPKAMDFSIKYILKKNLKILITFPNNDFGYKEILSIIKKYSLNKNVYIRKNLGVEYFKSLENCKFVIGNSSSGFIEAPYFSKRVINIGERQKGRELSPNITSISTNLKSIKSAIDKAVNKKIKFKQHLKLHGSGKSTQKVLSRIKNFLK